jgi:branched-chain amino acid transport system permease protein
MLFHLLINGLSLGAVYALIALGLVVVFKGSGVINFAHGALFTLSAYLGFTFLKAGLPYGLALLSAALGTMMIGVAIERIAYRPLIRNRNPVVFKAASIACAFIVIGMLRSIYGQQGDFLSYPPIFEVGTLMIGDFLVPVQQLLLLACATVALLSFGAFFRFSRAGRIMQAVAEDPEASRIVGINVDRVFMLIWGAGAFLGGVAGVLMAPVTMIYPDMGLYILIKAFAAAALGGFDHLGGVVLGGLILGVLEICLSFYFGSQFQEVIGFAVILLVLVFRPQGLFGNARVVRV